VSSNTHDLVVIGAGPAGMSAALTAASCGLKTMLLDEQPRPGGEIYRNTTEVPPMIAAMLGTDYRHGNSLATRLMQSSVKLRFGTLVWDVAGGHVTK
jgi:thioredoxin reductase